MERSRFGPTTGGIIKGVFHHRKHAKPALYVSLIGNYVLMCQLCPPGTMMFTLWFDLVLFLQRGDKICGNPCPICRDPNVIIHYQVCQV